jgi:MT0933-like antitoxin protein
MGLMDTVKGWFGGNKEQMKAGVDKGADVIKDKVPEEHAGKVDQGADAAKDAIDKLD